MKYSQYPVHVSLQNWIRYFWSYDADTSTIQTLHIRSFADCYPRLIFQDIRNSSAIKNGLGNQMPICFLSGLDTQPSDAYWESRFSHFGVSFYPHALHALFRINAAELTNQMPDILSLDKTEIPNILLTAANHQERVSVLSHYFYNRIFKGNSDNIINDLLHRPELHQFAAEGNLSKIAHHYNISERQFQRRFKQNVGVSAYKFNRVLKFEKSLQLLSSARYGELTQLAYEFGYSDQSHFINDFKAFSGLSPYEFIKQNNVGSESSSFIYERDNL